LSLEFVADEDVDYRLIKILRNKGWKILSILEESKGISDREVLDIVLSKNAILITEDSDFGEWVFAHGFKIGVIFLRYKQEALDKISNVLIKVIEDHGENLKEKFVVITPNKIRIREI